MGHSQSKHSAHQPPSSYPPSTPYSSQANFTYTPLNHPRNFRILHLKRSKFQGSGDWKDTVLSGTLVETSLDNVPEYFALSYTWGDSTLCDYILIDGRVLKITRSCAAALRRMLKGKLERVIWVDSICINQARDTQATQERNTQVAFMDEIYNKAIQVNVHLGEGDERTEVAAKAVNKLGAASIAVLGARRIGVGEETLRRRYEKVADEVLQPSQEFPYGKLHPIMRLPWFRRVWVFQEVVLARKVVFYCGERLLAFENLAFATDFTRVPYSKPDPLAIHWRSYLQGHNACIHLLRLKEKGEDTKLVHQYLLTIIANLEATRPEDKIHSMYGYAKRMNLDWPIPDYTKSVAQIYTEATIACFRQSKDLEVLHMAIGPASVEFELPSWVPDFSRRHTDYSLSKPPKIDLVPFRNKQCSGATECDWILIPDGRRLKVKGRKVDYITAVSEPWQADATTTLLGGADFNSGQIYDSLIECIGSWYEVALQPSMTHNGGADSAHQSVAISDLVCLLTRACLGLTTLPDQFAEHVSVLIGCTRRDMVALRTAFIHPGNDNNEFRIAPQIQQAIECLAPVIWKLVFRTAVESCMGISNYNAKAGDLLVVLHGMASPCVIRPCAGGFNFIGQAFVPEVMNGEFWDGGSDEDDEWFTLI